MILLYKYTLGENREDFALSLLEQFKNKLHSCKQSNKQTKPEELEDEEDDWYAFRIIN